MNVLPWTSSPTFATAGKFEFDDTFCAEAQRDHAIEILRRRRHKHTFAFAQGPLHLWLTHDLREVRRADFFFTLGNEEEINWKFATRSADCMQCCQNGRLRTFLIYCPATDKDFAESGFVDECALPRGRRPFGGIDLLDVIHEVEPDGFRCAGVQRGKD